ncbi:unnamed protein product [Thlaspi arvense]|uniref:Uncharacterized protein n=1 Tax=Thlaspi arvense TaxID=13288 RepID=A0AAU9RWS3_THLAR|nr:unnamed protein product [Thlaspi arvense]
MPLGGDGEFQSYYELVTDLKSLLDTDGSLSSIASSFLRCFSAAIDARLCSDFCDDIFEPKLEELINQLKELKILYMILLVV